MLAPTLSFRNHCFNPCFNGTYSLTHSEQKSTFQALKGFNPCFNGTYSLTGVNPCSWLAYTSVLILVLMELTL